MYQIRTYCKPKSFLVLSLLILCRPLFAQELYKLLADGRTGWASFENPSGAKGRAALENKGAKGHAFNVLKAGESKTLLDVKGAGIIKRIWMTMTDANPVMLRSLRIDMYWDGSEKPAVSVPLGDFFGVGLGRMAAFQSALFADPEGRSFNSYVPMPFKRHARIVVTNESDKEVMLLFYDIDFLRLNKLPGDALYFHAYWSRNNHIKLGQDFEVLPKVEGKGRFLGCNLGIIADTAAYGNSWWGEGEIRMYLDGDNGHPSIAGTGTEDYIGTGWGMGVFSQLYQGCTVADTKKHQWAFYRYHIPDPVYFRKDCKIAIEQIGGAGTDYVRQLVKAGAPLIPVTVDISSKRLTTRLVKLLEMNPPVNIMDVKNFPDGFTAFYRLDNYSATAYFYLDKPGSNLPALAPLKERTEGLKE
jgi:hypothetical protein